MPSYVIGLDLGQRSVKAAVLKNAFRGYEVEDFLSLEIDSLEAEETVASTLSPAANPPNGGDAPTESEPGVSEAKGESEAPPSLALVAARRILDSINLEQAVVVAALPGSRVSSWVVEPPFSDPRRVRQTIDFEVENYVPWDLDEVVFDYTILPEEGFGTRVLTAMAPQEFVAESLQSWERIGVQPKHLAAEVVELARLLPSTEDAEVILDLGERRTLICVAHQGQAVWVRCLDLGTDSFTEDGSGQASWASGIRASLLAADQVIKAEIEGVHVCGNTADQTALFDQLGEELGVPVRDIVLPESPIHNETAPRPAPEHALAYALALKGLASRNSAGICFRQGSFSYQADSRLRARLTFFGLAALVLLGIGLVAMHFVQLNQLRTELAERNLQLSSTVVASFPETDPAALATADGAIAVVQEQVAALQWRVEALEGPKNSSLSLLRELSNTVPTGIAVDLDEYLVNAEMIRIRGETDSFGSVDKVEAAILKNEMFKGAKKSDVNKSRDGKMRFIVTIPRKSEDQEVGG
ncbi:MAG: pilus assembly protein PilM [Myxococcota bacterium]|nr:pilus assembly protein PilM [Myxococcota bacterium]